MFFGHAKQLCPNLQAVPYDFHAYKEVAQAMYETLARYRVQYSHVHCFFSFDLLLRVQFSLAF